MLSVTASESEPLSRRDLGLLFALCLLIYSLPVALNPLLSTHESVHCQNVREMLADGDWIIPHYGGRVWLERPPLPHWMTAAVVVLSGQTEAEWAYRLSAVLAGSVVAVLVGWMASVWFGRALGLLSGITVATMREFFHYALAPESDIFLTLVVTGAVACFVHAEWVARSEPERLRFVGARSWSVLGFFVLLGLTNMAKGLFFGMCLAAVPVAGYLLTQRSWAAWRRYVWLPGWAAFAVAALAWPIAAYLRHPDVTELWASDYLGRLNKGFVREPLWYYLVHLPWAVFPWTGAVLVGFGAALGRAWKERGSPERFLVGWGVLTVAFLSVPQGKHHHYLLPVLAPWAVLAARGAVLAWEWLRTAAPGWVRSPIPLTLLVGGAGDIGLVILQQRHPERVPYLPVLLVALPLYVALCWWAYTRRTERVALMMSIALVIVGFWAVRVHHRFYEDSYRADREFVGEVMGHISEEVPLVVLNDMHPLDSSWALFYLPARARLIHNLSFLHDETLGPGEMYLVGRGAIEEQLRSYGQVERMAQSRVTRHGRRGAECWTLFRVRLHEGLWRGPVDVRISPMQATGRDVGPFVVPGDARQASRQGG